MTVCVTSNQINLAAGEVCPYVGEIDTRPGPAVGEFFLEDVFLKFACEWNNVGIGKSRTCQPQTELRPGV
jgi:hypothetical protein